ncbi:MAG: zf-HC2 domain-containing protein [Acidimicrobiaceae bacterium]|nr:zf-HC2 domain-containing protein [Acidimicrobiaceae bacterium]MBO0747993.1 zf-HC2 domain-containing protein [Acidimicrobiaceae bacterium]
MSCREVVEQVTDYLEGSLSRRARRRFEAHLAHCLQCPEYVEQIRAVIRAAGQPDPRAPAPPGEAEVTRLYRILREE